MAGPSTSPQQQRAPRVAGAVLAAEALLMLGVAAWQEAGALTSQAQVTAVAQGTAAYFLVFGVLVAGLAVAVWLGVRAAFGAAVFLQVLALPLAVTMASERFWVGALVLGTLALVGLVTLLSPSGREAFGRG
jgi:uncharacterized membrane protein